MQGVEEYVAAEEVPLVEQKPFMSREARAGLGDGGYGAGFAFADLVIDGCRREVVLSRTCHFSSAKCYR